MDYKWVALSVTTIGVFMSSLDSNIVVIGLPTILQKLNASIVHGIWIITGYALNDGYPAGLSSVAWLIYTAGSGFIIWGLQFSTVGSLFCALSRTGTQLVIFRFLQGGGAALLTANSVAIITDAFSQRRARHGFGYEMMAMNLGAIVGLTLGGIMIPTFGWQSIFLINIPIGIFGTVWVTLRLKEISVKPVGQKFDYAGAILFASFNDDSAGSGGRRPLFPPQ